MVEPDIHDRILLSVERVLVLRKERDEAEARLAAATREYRDLVDSIGIAQPGDPNAARVGESLNQPELDEGAEQPSPQVLPNLLQRRVLPPLSQTVIARSTQYVGAPKTVDASAIPAATTGVSVRAALHRFFAAQTAPVTQAAAIGLMVAKGFDRKSVETAIYDMTSPKKIGTLDRTSTGLVLNEGGRAVAKH